MARLGKRPAFKELPLVFVDAAARDVRQHFHSDSQDPQSHRPASTAGEPRPVTFAQLKQKAGGTVALCGQGVVQLSGNIAFARTQLKQLLVCCNRIPSVPFEIGHLKGLTVLSLAHNCITALPDSIGLLASLLELSVGGNSLTRLPASIGLLSKLSKLEADHNQITELPNELGSCAALVHLDLSFNALTRIPAEISRIKYLRVLNVDANPLITYHEPAANAALPSLKELAARTIIRDNLPILSTTPASLRRYLASYQVCSFSSCNGPFFETCYTRVRFIDRNEELIPYEYRLCCNHWSNDREMRYAMFDVAPVQRMTAPPASAPVTSATPQPQGSANPTKTSSVTHLVPILESYETVDAGVYTVGCEHVPLSTLVSKYPALPALHRSGAVKDEEIEQRDSRADVPGLLKRTRSRLARSKSMSFLFRGSL